jgi:bla regulator protein BlaR1
MIQQINMLGRMWAMSLWQASVQIAVFVMLVAIASFLLRRSSPVVRYCLWCLVLVRLCIPFGFSFTPSSASSTPEHTRAEWRARHAEFHAREGAGGPHVSEFRERMARERRLMAATGATWLGGSFLIVVLVGWRAVFLRRRIRRLPLVTAPEFAALLDECVADMGLRRAIQVRMAPDDECPAPAVTALFRPVIILPQTMVNTWSAEELKPILIHELAHVRRRDISVNWIQIVLQTFYFFHPLVWLANWKIRVLREEACDDLSISKLGGLRHVYSSSLLRAIELANSARPTWGVVALAERKSDLVKRLRRVLRPEYRPAQESRLKIAAKVLALGSMCLLLSGMIPVHTMHHRPGGCPCRASMCHGRASSTNCAISAAPEQVQPAE